jgi:hypothetical protein
MPFPPLTAPPCAPLVGRTPDGVADDEGDPLEALAVLGAVTVGTVASLPSRTSTWPAASEVLAWAVVPNAVAILLPLPDAPVP